MSEEARIALVTGASRGIGKAIAQALATGGCTVIGTATSDTGAQGITEYLQAADNPGKGMVLKVGDQESVTAVIKAISADYGAPTVLVNNAGITRDNLFMRMSEDEWDSVLNVNLTSAMLLSKGVMRGMMKARWGRIVNISSVVGVTGNPGQANYAASKAGLVGMSKSLAYEVASRGITVNAVAPGFITTAMTDKLTEDQQAKILEQVPAGRMGEADEIAAAVLFLSSPEAGYVTGATLHVNGGMAML